MNQRKISSAFFKTTIVFPAISALNKTKGFLKQRLPAMSILAISFIFGFCTCYFLFPRTINNEEKPFSKPHDPWAEHLATLWENGFGVLVVRDNEAQTILHKRAAIDSKYGFRDLKNGTYKVTNYFHCRNTGYGLVNHTKKDSFLLVWHSGEVIKAPTENPGAIKITTRRVEIGY